MENRVDNFEESKIRGLLDYYLNRQKKENGISAQENHLDEDSLTAFVEGNLTARESQLIVNHLVDCSFCRHITTELVRLDYEFADEPMSIAVTEKQPSKVSEVLQGLFSRIFGTSEDTVFAHHESEEPNKDKEKLE